MAKTSYAVALGSNRRHGRHGAPARIVRAAVQALAAAGMDVTAVSAVRTTCAVGPAGRGFANAVALLESDMSPPELLASLKQMERAFGRRSGRRWGARVLDLDIILWSEGSWAGSDLVVPHPAFRERAFVLEPLAQVAPGWRDPLTGATVRQLLVQVERRAPVDRVPARS